jgi:hypothetical protein
VATIKEDLQQKTEPADLVTRTFNDYKCGSAQTTPQRTLRRGNSTLRTQTDTIPDSDEYFTKPLKKKAINSNYRSNPNFQSEAGDKLDPNILAKAQPKGAQARVYNFNDDNILNSSCEQSMERSLSRGHALGSKKFQETPPRGAGLKLGEPHGHKLNMPPTYPTNKNQTSVKAGNEQSKGKIEKPAASLQKNPSQGSGIQTPQQESKQSSNMASTNISCLQKSVDGFSEKDGTETPDDLTKSRDEFIQNELRKAHKTNGVICPP